MIKIKKSVYPDSPLPFNEWIKYIHDLIFQIQKTNRHETKN